MLSTSECKHLSRARQVTPRKAQLVRLRAPDLVQTASAMQIQLVWCALELSAKLILLVLVFLTPPMPLGRSIMELL